MICMHGWRDLETSRIPNASERGVSLMSPYWTRLLLIVRNITGYCAIN